MKTKNNFYICDVCALQKDKKDIYTIRAYGEATVDMCMNCYNELVKQIRNCEKNEKCGIKMEEL